MEGAGLPLDDDAPLASDAGPSSSTSANRRGAQSLANLDPSTINWDVWRGTYKDRALITRLVHVANVCSDIDPPSSNLNHIALTALRRLIHEIKANTWDHRLYAFAVAQIDRILRPTFASSGNDETMDGLANGKVDKGKSTAESGSASSAKGEQDGLPDMEWIEETRENERREGARLDVELRGYMSNLIKESIRLTYLAFAQMAAKSGSCENAMKSYNAAREYSSSPTHNLDMLLGILDTCLTFNHPSLLSGQIARLEAALERVHPPPTTGSGANASSAGPTGPAGRIDPASLTLSDVRESRAQNARGVAVRQAVKIKIRVWKGLMALTSGKFDEAGRELGEVGEEGGLGEWEGVAISTSDLSLISSLCILASASRDRVRSALLDRTSFRSGLDDTQKWIVDLIRAFMDAKYAEVAALLEKAKPFMILNPFLCPHADEIIRRIQTRSIIQYIEPFSSIKIETMATAFGMSADDTLKVVESLVESKQINGRIDLIDMILTVKTPELRKELYKRAMIVGDETASLTQAALTRMKLHEAKITVDPRPKNVATGGRLMGPTDSNDIMFGPDDGPDGLGVDLGVAA